MRILLVEDDEQVTAMLVESLTEQHYAVDVANDGQTGWDLAEAYTYDLIVLDMMLPKLDGIGLCRRLRSKNYRMPVLMLTARDTSTDKVMGLDAGADDYVVKPFNLSELSARIRALLRRGEVPISPVLQWGDLVLDPTTCQVHYAEQPLHLSPKEYNLLELFMRNSRRVFSRTAILDHLWSFEDSPSEDTVKAHIKGLRQKLKTVGAAELIETVYGLGYRLKSLDGSEKAEKLPASRPTPPSTPAPATTAPPEETLADKTTQAQAAIIRAWEKSKEGMLRRVMVLEEAIEAWRSGSVDEAMRQRAEQEAHKLAGSAGMFGFAKGTDLARQLEQAIQAFTGGDAPIETWAMQVRLLRQELEGEPKLTRPATATPSPPLPCDDRPLELPSDDRPLLLVIDDDTALVDSLACEATAWNLQTLTATDLRTARDLIAARSPDVVLLDLSFADTAATGLELLAELTDHNPPIPVLVFTASHGLADKVAVARLGGRTFLQKPTTPTTVLHAVSQVLQYTRNTVARLLIVDDDTTILSALRELLQPWGFHLMTLDDPRQFWQTLELTMPDLLVMDITMPHVDGIELCRVVRNDPQWNWLPILFLTAHTDAVTIQRVFEAGADDYIAKPIAGPELVTRIHNRLERTKLLRSMAETDALTGVANRQKSIQEINRFLTWAKQYHHPLGLAVIDLDQCKQINDQYGHATGDRLLQQASKLLRESFRGEDIVARWGGATFVIAMYDMTRREGIERLAEALDRVEQEQLMSIEGEPIRLAFSAGVAQYPLDGSDLPTLYQAAATAIKQAGAAGGSRIYPAGRTVDLQDHLTCEIAVVGAETEAMTTLTRALTRRGYQIQWLQQRKQVEERLSRTKPSLQAQLILVDVDLPQLNIEKLIKQVSHPRQGTHRARVIALVSDSQMAETVLQLGAYDYLIKPYKLSILLQRIRQALVT